MKNEIEVFSDFELKRKINQEDFLIEIAENFSIELERSSMSRDEIKERLNCNDAFLIGIEEGFANLTVRELADVFSVFNKVIQLSLLSEMSTVSRRNVLLKISDEDPHPIYDSIEIKGWKGSREDSLVRISFMHSESKLLSQNKAINLTKHENLNLNQFLNGEKFIFEGAEIDECSYSQNKSCI